MLTNSVRNMVIFHMQCSYKSFFDKIDEVVGGACCVVMNDIRYDTIDKIIAFIEHQLRNFFQRINLQT